jgi:hypothetical protein
MPNNIAVSVTADVADLQVKRAIMSAELKAATKDLNDFAKTAKTSGLTDELRTGMLAAGDAMARTRNQIASVDSELKNLQNTETADVGAKQKFIAALQEQVATQGLSRKELLAYRAAQMGVTDEAGPLINALKSEAGHAVNSRASFEGLVLVHEALQGRTSRMAGSAMILTQALAGGEATSAALSAVMSPLGLAIAAVAAVTVGAAIATVQYDAAQKQLYASTLGVGAAAGLSSQQLNAAGEAASKWSQQSVRASTEAAQAFAAAGVKSQEAVTSLAGDVEIFAQLTGEKAADAQKTLAEAMRDPVKGAEDLNASLGILDGTTMEHIRTLSAMGDKDGAVTALVQALQQRMDEAKASGVGLSGQFSQMTARLSDLWTWLGKVNEQLSIFQQFGFSGAGITSQAEGQAQRQAKIVQSLAALNQASAGGAALAGATPEGQDQAKRDELLGSAGKLAAAIVADTALRGANSEAVKRDKEALAEYTRAYQTFIPEVEKAHKISVLQDQLAVAKRAHNKGLIDDLSKQIELTKLAGQVMSPADADRAATDAGKLGADRAGAGKKSKGPSVVSEWQEQLHAAEIASNDFFGDQTQRELDFWEGKVGLTKKGSKEWLEVQTKIYEAQKTLARQGYQQHLADLNDQIEADHNNWSAVQKDWAEKLAYIKSKFGEQSTEYLNANREFARLEREHQDQMFQAQRDGEKKQLEELKSHLSAMRAIRQTDAGATEAAIRDKEQGSPLGEIETARKLAQLHQQLNLQELADLETTYNSENALLSDQVARSRTAYTEDSKQYKDAVAAKAKADKDYYDAKARLESQANAQSIQDILAVKQAYHSYIDGVVGSTVSGLVGVTCYTQTWQQAISGVYNSLLGTINQMLTKMVTNWIVTHVFMTSAQRAQLAIQAAQHTAVEGAKTAATTTGVAVRTGVESTGFFAKLLGLLGIHLGAHVATEAGKTAATAAGATARATAEGLSLAAAAIAQRAAAAAQVPVLVGLAGAGGVASMAAAPFPIDLTAPAFGASMAASAAAFGAMATLAVGTNEVPNDMIAQIHAGERIIPAADNKALMAAINDNGIGPSRQAAGDMTTQHNYNYHDHSGRATPSQIYSNRAALAKAIMQAKREGHFAGFRM